jgi:hypothetical protein
MAAKRRTFAETLNEDLTPEMEAFRKGEDPVQESLVPAILPEISPTPDEAEEPVPKGKNRKLVVELEPDLYDAFSTVCFHKKLKMAKLVRKWIEDFSKEG